MKQFTWREAVDVDRVRVLDNNPIFSAASPDSLARLIQSSRLRRYAAGEEVLAEGQPSKHIFALERGAVRVFHMSPMGEEVALKLFSAPAIFGEAEAFCDIPYLEHVTAVEESQILVMPPAAVLRLLRVEPECAVRMLVDVATRLAIAAYNEKSLAFNPATIRLANYLLDYAKWTNASGAQELQLDLNQDQMAAAIGVTRRSIAKDIIAWQKEGVLVRRRGKYILLEPESLGRYSDPERLGLAYSLDDLKRILDRKDPFA